MNDFITWCNTNTGFVSAVLAIMSIVFSALAIIVSIRVAKMPFKKKILLSYHTVFGVGANEGIKYFSVEAINIGNRLVRIGFVGLGYKKHFKWQKAYNINDHISSDQLLGINDSIESKYELSQVDLISKTHCLYAIAIDVEGKVYKRKLK